jgi:hypothetical protein
MLPMIGVNTVQRHPIVAGLIAGVLVTGAACGNDGGSDMNPPKESVSDGIDDLTGTIELAILAGSGVFGLAGGTGQDQVRDGWRVDYSKFLVAVGTFDFVEADGTRVSHQELGVIDLMSAAPATTLTSLELEPGATSVRFSLPNVTTGFSAVAPATTADYDLMASNGYSVYFEGTIEKTGGQSCKPGVPADCKPATSIKFRWGVPAGELFDDCPDLEVAAGETLTAMLTVPGDPWFFTSFDPAATPVRRAQWIADADLNRDGETTIAELKQIKASVLLTPTLGYKLTGAPITVSTVYSFLEAQARTLGRNGMGMCGKLTRL